MLRRHPSTRGPLHAPTGAEVDQHASVWNNSSKEAAFHARTGPHSRSVLHDTGDGIAAEFLSPANVERMRRATQEALAALLRAEPMSEEDRSVQAHQIGVPVNEAFLQTVHDTLRTHPRLLRMQPSDSSVSARLEFLNRQVVEHETRVRYASLRRRRLYERWFLRGNRMRVMPRAQPGSAVARHDVQVSTSGYMNAHPHGIKHHAAYLKHVHNLP